MLSEREGRFFEQSKQDLERFVAYEKVRIQQISSSQERTFELQGMLIDYFLNVLCEDSAYSSHRSVSDRLALESTVVPVTEHQSSEVPTQGDTGLSTVHQDIRVLSQKQVIFSCSSRPGTSGETHYMRVSLASIPQSNDPSFTLFTMQDIFLRSVAAVAQCANELELESAVELDYKTLSGVGMILQRSSNLSVAKLHMNNLESTGLTLASSGWSLAENGAWIRTAPAAESKKMTIDESLLNQLMARREAMERHPENSEKARIVDGLIRVVQARVDYEHSNPSRRYEFYGPVFPRGFLYDSKSEATDTGTEPTLTRSFCYLRWRTESLVVCTGYQSTWEELKRASIELRTSGGVETHIPSVNHATYYRVSGEGPELFAISGDRVFFHDQDHWQEYLTARCLPIEMNT